MTQSKNLKILIIEDNPTSAFLLCQYLFDLLFTDIHIFSDAKSGMEAVRLIKPDIIFLDILLKMVRLMVTTWLKLTVTRKSVFIICKT